MQYIFVAYRIFTNNSMKVIFSTYSLRGYLCLIIEGGLDNRWDLIIYCKSRNKLHGAYFEALKSGRSLEHGRLLRDLLKVNLFVKLL